MVLDLHCISFIVYHLLSGILVIYFINIIITACVNKSASLKEHFFLGKLYVSFEKVYNNMIGNIISFYRIFVLCN